MIETVYYEGVTRRPWSLKLNPIWWFGNDEEPVPPDWYKPGQWDAWRTFSWYMRNPLQNFGRYVIGVYDRPHWVTGPQPAMENLWSDLHPPQLGWKWAIIQMSWPIFLPYVSYSGKFVTFYLGWQPSGFFGLKLNFNVNFQLW
jgi:hypothetical protein